MTAEAKPPPQLASPQRKRRVGLKLLVAAIVVAVSLMGMVWLTFAVWRGKEHAELTKRLDAIRALGEPIELRDVVEPDVPDDENLATLIRAAIAVQVEDAVRARRETALRMEDPNAFTLPLTDEELQLTRADVTANAAALAIIAKADARSRVAWHDDPTSSMLLWSDKTLGQSHQLATVIHDAARLAAIEGRSDAVLDDVLDMQAVGSAVQCKPTFAGYLFGISVESMAAKILLQHASDLRTGSDPGEALPDTCRKIIRTLLDDAKLKGVFRNGLMGERMYLHEGFSNEAFKNTALGPTAAGAPLLAPLADRNEVAVLDFFAEALRVIDAPSRAEFTSRSGELNRMRSEIAASSTLMLASIALPSVDRFFETRYRSMIERHLAATALAIRLYQHDHAGQRPATLDELVPNYLPLLPTDGIDGRPLRYDPKRAILWGVGDDGKDGGGDATPTRKAWPPDLWNMTDAVAFLDRQPRPATQPASNQ